MHKRRNDKRRKSDRPFVPSPSFIERQTEGIRSTWRDGREQQNAADLAEAIIKGRTRIARQGGGDA
jgi:hypothetical protein